MALAQKTADNSELELSQMIRKTIREIVFEKGEEFKDYENKNAKEQLTIAREAIETGVENLGMADNRSAFD